LDGGGWGVSSFNEEKEYIAHVRKNRDGSWAKPQLLPEHLNGTARLAEIFAAKFQSTQWGKAAGLAHDVGKGRLVWQNYLRVKSGFFDAEAHLEGKPGKMPHAVHGAKLVEELFGKGLGRILAYCIAGHHAGLPDWSNAEGTGQAALRFQESQVKDLKEVAALISDDLALARPEIPPWKFTEGLDLSLWIRMLYSCLVDADFLDTELYMEEDKAKNRGGYCSIAELEGRFHQFSKRLDDTSEDTYVNSIRREIRDKCIRMADESQGVFSLSVPTGGGKTLSSLAFGLAHARKHQLDRIIYVIPYTSIIEQNANVFRSVLGEDQVVEHHSSLDEDDETPQSRLAAENWDAPLIVTTSVQFFESLFAAKPSRCRKLHNIVKSVVVLDEAQLVPVEYLAPLLEALQLLVDHYQVSLVISTATQPAFGECTVEGKPFKGLKNIKEIMGKRDAIRKLFDSLKRVEVELPQKPDEPTSWEEIATELRQYDQVLCVVSDRGSCRELYNLMPEGTYHLSALMCGQHRSETIEKIKQKLKDEEPVRVISTQLVEAGVDFDFPVVYRAFAGLDSIAQAAGRCNREGKMLPEFGKVVIFNAPKKAPAGILRKAADTASGILATSPKDPLEYSLFEQYFKELYWKANSLDKEGIISLLTPDQRECGIYFRTAAAKFKMIDDSGQKTVLVRYGESEKWIDQLKLSGPERWLMRKLQRYAVNIRDNDFNRMLQRGSLEAVQPGIYALTSSIEYSEQIGLLVDETIYDPEKLIY
jgi:CRISPR-associated endonuclease/helicase Cas3